RSEWLAVALKAFFRPEATAGLRATVALRFDDAAFRARIDDGSLALEESPEDSGDLTLLTDVETLIGYLAGAGVPLAALAAEGDTAILDRVLEIFAFGLSERGRA